MLTECCYRRDACWILTGTELKQSLRAVKGSFCFDFGLAKNKTPVERCGFRPWNRKGGGN